MISKSYSINNRFIVEAYKSETGLRSANASGFAMIEQKVMVKGLTLLADAWFSVGNERMHVSKGSKVYIREEYLYTQPWAKKILKSDNIEGEFIIVDAQYVEFIDYPSIECLKLPTPTKGEILYKEKADENS